LSSSIFNGIIAFCFDIASSQSIEIFGKTQLKCKKCLLNLYILFDIQMIFNQQVHLMLHLVIVAVYKIAAVIATDFCV